jgi:hypothetical protein
LPRNSLLKQIAERKIEERIEVVARRGRRRKQLLDDFKESRRLEIGRGSTSSPSMENSIWKSLRTCLKKDYMMILKPEFEM